MEKLAGKKQISNLRARSRLILYISRKENKEYIAELDYKFSINVLVKGTRTSCKLPQYSSNCVIAHTHLNSLFPSSRDLITALFCCCEFNTSFHCVISKNNICVYQPSKKLKSEYKKCNKKSKFKKCLHKALKTISTEVKAEYASMCKAIGYNVLFLEF